MKILYCYLCRFAESNADGTYSALGADFENVLTETYPAAPNISIVLKFSGEDQPSPHIPVIITVRNPQGQESEPMLVLLNQITKPDNAFPSVSKSSRIAINLGPFVLPTPGEYTFKVQIGHNPEAMDSVSLSLTAWGGTTNATV